PAFESARLNLVEVGVLPAIQEEMFVGVCAAREHEYLGQPVNEYLVVGSELSGDLGDLRLLIFQRRKPQSDPNNISHAEDQYQHESQRESIFLECLSNYSRTCAACHSPQQTYGFDGGYGSEDRHERKERYQIHAALDVDRTKPEVHDRSQHDCVIR